MNTMNTHQQAQGRYHFAAGLVAGTVVGAGLAMWLAPRGAADLRHRLTDSARRLGRRASETYEQAGTRVGEAVEELTRKGQDVRDDIAGVVARGAQEVERGAKEVERYATAVTSERR